jgi:hypothetical protein
MDPETSGLALGVAFFKCERARQGGNLESSGINSTAKSERRMNIHYESIRPMTAENVEEFDVWIVDSQDLIVSIVSHQAAWRATTEEYDISQH